jgi:2'-5' RNA ligase
MQLRDRDREGEPETRPRGVAGALAAIEALGDVAAFRFRDPGPLIGDDDPDMRTGLFADQADLAARGREFERVIEQIGDRLLDHVAIARDREPGRTAHGKGDLPLFGDGAIEFGEVGEQVIGQILTGVRERCQQVSPFTARLRRPEVWANAVVCPVYPGPALRQLWTIVREVAPEAGQPEQKPRSYFPHLTLAYATGHSDDGPLREQLACYDHAEPVISVDALTLVAQQHDGSAITWNVAAVIPLGGR